MAVTLINRHLQNGAEVCVEPGTGSFAEGNAQLLTAPTPHATNSADQPDRVAPIQLGVAADGANAWRLDLPPHSLATLVLGSG